MQRAQRTSFNTLDNWGHKIPTQSKKRKDDIKENLNTLVLDTHNALGYIPPTHLKNLLPSYIPPTLHIAINKTKGCR